MTFSSYIDFERAKQYFENHSKFIPSEIDENEMIIYFEANSTLGANNRKERIENEIFNCSFEYEKFEVV